MKSLPAILSLLLLLLPALASPDEASGIVTQVVDGDTIDVDGVGRVRFADIDCPEMDTDQGPVAKDFTSTWLAGKTVYLDIDDLSRTDNYGRIVSVVYLPQSDDTLANFNRALVDNGQACMGDFSDNEFSPDSWWGGHIPAGACIKGASSQASSISPAVSPSTSSQSGQFVGSSQSNKYHYPSCRWAEKINPENVVWFSSSEDARSQGYVACGVCHPP